MELRHLRYFVAVAEELHFGRAAERVGIAQPPLSQQIQQLEAILGVQLFDRSRRRVSLTEAGRQFLPEAQATLSQAERARRVVLRAARGEVGRLEVVFTGSSPLTTLMPRTIKAFREKYPDVQLGLREMPTAQQVVALADGEVDVGFVRPGVEIDDARISVRTVIQEPLIVVLNEEHRFGTCATLTMADLADEPFILPPRVAGTGLRDRVEQLCRAAAYVPRIVLEAHQLSAVISMAAAGIGISIVPRSMSQVRAEGVAFIPISDAGAHIELAVATRRDETQASVINFLRVAAAQAG